MENDNHNDLTYFGVLMNRNLISTGIYLFKPEYLIEGTIEEEDKEVYFTDTMANEYLTIHDSETLYSDQETAIGYIISDEELTEKYPELSIPEAKIEYFDSIRNLAHIGFYLPKKDKIIVTSFDLMTMLETLNGMDIAPNSNSAKIPLDTIKQANISEYDNSKEALSKAIDEFGGQELVVMSNEIFKDLITSKTLDEIKEKLTKIKKDHESINLAFGDEQKDQKKAPKIEIGAFSKNEITGKHIIDLFNATYDTLIAHDSIEEIKKTIGQVVEVYTDLSLALDKFEKEGYNIDAAVDSIYCLVDKYEELLKLTNIDLIKKGIKEINKTEVNNITAIANLYDDANKKNELMVVEQKHEEKQNELEESFNGKKKANSSFNYSEVYNQMIERIIGRDKQIGRILTAIDKMDISIGTGKKHSILIAGTTGTGKTQTFNELKKAMSNRPIVVVDTNQLTQEGYVGGTIEKNILGTLLTEAHTINNKGKKDNGTITQADLELAESGIVILDEIDKRAERGPKDNVNCGAVIDQLLKFMDGTTYIAEVGKQNIPVDTSKIGVMASGAFQEYFDKKSTRRPGFNVEEVKETDEFKKYFEVKPEDLVEYGLDNQFIGRFQYVILYPPHTLESLVELETTEATSNLGSEIKYFQAKGVELVWEEGFIEEAAAEAIKLKTGGRGLSNIISRCLGDAGDEINRKQNEYKILFLSKETIKDPGKVFLLKKNGEHVLMQDVLEKNLQEASNVRKLKKISFNQDALQEVLKYKSSLCKEESLSMEISNDQSKVKHLGKN